MPADVVGAVAARVLTGKYLDFIGRRKLLVITMAVSILASLAYLAAEGCDLGQGFLIGRPAAAAAWGAATRMQSPVHRRAATR